MIPQKRLDQQFKSLPVSRINSSRNLNQLSQQAANNPYISNPSTPGPYVSSSLNPGKNIRNEESKEARKENDAEVFESLPIVEKVRQFEQTLTNLSNCVSSFKEEELTKNLEDLVNLNHLIHGEIEELKNHQEIGNKIISLEEEEKKLDSTNKYILKELVSYRNELKKLPRLPSNRSKDNTKTEIEVNEVLKYAMKLSKFTKVLPSVLNAPLNVHPNNYIWPAEDALRRGMLALSSIRAEDLINNELGSSEKIELNDNEEEMEDVEDVSMISNDQPSKAKVHKEVADKPKEAPIALDLDLFDPDEEDFSD